MRVHSAHSAAIRRKTPVLDELDDDNPDDADTAPCPECGAEIYADLDHCPQCGHWLTDADRRSLDRDAGFFSSRRVRLVALGMLVVFLLSFLAELILL